MKIFIQGCDLKNVRSKAVLELFGQPGCGRRPVRITQHPNTRAKREKREEKEEGGGSGENNTPRAYEMGHTIIFYIFARDVVAVMVWHQACHTQLRAIETRGTGSCHMALSWQAMQFWFVECADKILEDESEIKKVLRERFSPNTHNYQVDAKFNQMRMQPGQWEAENRALLNLRAQVPWNAAQDLFNVYFLMLTQYYMETVFLHNAKTLDEATLFCRQKALEASVSADTPKLGQAQMRRKNFTPRFGMSYSGFGELKLNATACTARLQRLMGQWKAVNLDELRNMNTMWIPKVDFKAITTMIAKRDLCKPFPCCLFCFVIASFCEF